MKIFLTGSEGMLGYDIVRVFDNFEMTCPPRQALDITALDDVINAVRESRPDCIIHTAAYTNVDGAEAEPEAAYKVNGKGTRNLVMAAEELRVPIVYISTDYVFDGSKTGQYDEWDRTSPVNQYGLSKR